MAPETGPLNGGSGKSTTPKTTQNRCYPTDSDAAVAAVDGSGSWFYVSSESGPAIVCYTRCWSCMTQQCPGGWHTWADDDDIEHARATEQSDPTASRCGCPCADGPVIEYVGPPDLDEPVSLNGNPCPLCGELGACAYDAEGRPLIHALDGDDE